MAVSRLWWTAGLAVLMLTACDAGDQEKVTAGVSDGRNADVATYPRRPEAAESVPSATGSRAQQTAVAPLDEPVSITLSAGLGSDRRLMVNGATNLPQATRLRVQVERKASGVRWQERIDVNDGQFRAGPLGPGSGLLDGDYAVIVSLPPVNVQPRDVQQRLGQEGANLSGPLVGSSPHGLGKIVTMTQHFLIGSQPRESSDEVEVRALEP